MSKRVVSITSSELEEAERLSTPINTLIPEKTICGPLKHILYGELKQIVV